MSTIELPISAALAMLSLITVLVGNIYWNMRKPLEKLTEAVNGLNTSMSVAQKEKETQDKRINFLEECTRESYKERNEFYFKYQEALNFINDNKKALNKLLP